MVFDNEFNSTALKDFLRNENVEFHFTSPRSHTGNAVIERVHGTVNEHLRVLDAQKSKLSAYEKILFAAEKYNQSIHTITEVKPMDFVHCKIQDIEEIRKHLEHKNQHTIEKLNRSRIDFQIRDKGEVLVQNPEGARYKQKKKYVQIKSKVVDNKLYDNQNRNIHPCRIKREYKYQN